MTMNAQEPKEYTLADSGNRPVKFTGELLTEATSEAPAGYLTQRWHEASVYRTRSGKLVCQVRYRSTWRGEVNRDSVGVFESDDELAEFLEEYEPMDDVRGFPPGDKYATQQAALRDAIDAGWDTIVSKVLGVLPGAAEVID